MLTVKYCPSDTDIESPVVDDDVDPAVMLSVLLCDPLINVANVVEDPVPAVPRNPSILFIVIFRGAYHLAVPVVTDKVPSWLN